MLAACFGREGDRTCQRARQGVIALAGADLQHAFDAYRERVEVYASTWWAEPKEPQLSRLATTPGLREELDARARRSEMIMTDEVYVDEAGWEPQRQALHAHLLHELVGPPPTPVADVPAMCFITIGLPGSGKSSVVRDLVAAFVAARAGEAPAVLTSDADEIRTRLPEYEMGLGSGIVQPEVATLCYERDGYPPEGGLQKRLTELRTGVLIIDVLGDPDYLPPLVIQLAEWGWEVYVLRAELTPEVCVERVMERALTNGRFVPPELVLDSAGRPEAALLAALATKRLTGWAVIDTSGNVGGPARVVDGDETFRDAKYH